MQCLFHRSVQDGFNYAGLNSTEKHARYREGKECSISSREMVSFQAHDQPLAHVEFMADLSNRGGHIEVLARVSQLVSPSPERREKDKGVYEPSRKPQCPRPGKPGVECSVPVSSRVCNL